MGLGSRGVSLASPVLARRFMRDSADPVPSPVDRSVLLVGAPQVTHALATLLEERGIAVVEAEDAREAVEHAMRARPAVVVTDLGIGPPGALELIRMARQLRCLEGACVVAMSDLGSAVLDRAREAGAHAAIASGIGAPAIATVLAGLVTDDAKPAL